MVEGGPDALLLAYKNIQRGTPLVVVNNSGRISDALSYGYKLTEPEAPKKTSKEETEKKYTCKFLSLFLSFSFSKAKF